MEYQRLRNYGKLHTMRGSPQMAMKSISSLWSQLGISRFPKFVSAMTSDEHHWRKYQSMEARKRGITSKDLMESIRDSLTLYSSLLQVCGERETPEIYRKLALKQGIMVWSDFVPQARQFMKCPDPWEAVRQYFLEYFRANDRDGVFRFEVLQDSENELHVAVTDCAWFAIYSEAGYPNLPSIGSQVDITFLSRLMRRMGGDFQRERFLCRGDKACDWHFLRHKDQG